MHRSAYFITVLLVASVSTSLHAQYSDVPDQLLCADCPFPLMADMDMPPDGKIDLVLTSPFSTTIMWMKGHGDGTFDPPALLASNEHHLTIDLIGDADGDGDIDLVGMTLSSLYPDSVVALLRNNNGVFSTEIIDGHMSGTHAPDQFADIDGDGDLDLLSITGEQDVWYRNMGDGIYSRRIISRWCRPVQGPYTALDMDGDGDMDLIAYAYAPAYGRLIAHWNIGDGRFGPFTVASTFLGNYPDGLAIDVAELNNDGFPDLVVGGRPGRSLGDGTFDLSGAGVRPDAYQSVADVDCVPVLEAVMSKSDLPNVVVRALDNIGYIANMFPSPAAPVRTGLADLNGDGRDDLIMGPVFGNGAVNWRNNAATPPEVTFEIPTAIDTVTVDAVLFLSGGSPTTGGGYYEGPGVFGDSLYTDLLVEGWNVISYHHSSFLNSTHCQGSAVDSVYKMPGTGIDQHTKDRLVLFPDPADDHLIIRSATSAERTIMLFNMLGQPLFPPVDRRGVSPGDLYVTTAGLANGTYQVLVLERGVRRASATIIVQH